MDALARAAIVAAYFTPDDVARGAHRAFVGDVTWGAGLAVDTLLVVVAALSPPGRAWFERCRRHRRPWVGDAVFCATVELGRCLVALPLGLWNFDDARALGLSHETLARFLGLTARDALFGIAGFAALGAVLPMLRTRLGPRWWLAVGVAAALAVVADAALEPVRIELDYRLTPLADGPLRARIEALARARHADVGDIVVADTSRDSTGINAFVTGFGPSRKLVLTDTLVATGVDAAAGAAAHEIGHRRSERMPLRLALSALGVVAFLWLVERVVRFGLSRGSRGVAQAVPLVVATVTVVGLALLPIRAHFERAEEREADEVELSARTDLDRYVAEQVRLVRANALPPEPGAVDRLLASHPSPAERIARALWYKRRTRSEP